MKKLNIYFTAGVPKLQDTTEVMRLIQNAGADYMEVGMPYSDPVADGETIQAAHAKALTNGMTMPVLFEQLRSVKNEIKIPVVLMGYINPVLAFGVEKFCKECREAGVYGLIIPDLPPEEYEKSYRDLFSKYHLHFILLVTPETSAERLRYIDSLGSGFLYAVSSSSTTGNDAKEVYNEEYLSRLAAANLRNQIFVGFGIKNSDDFEKITEKVPGGIIGTAFMKVLLGGEGWQEKSAAFVRSIKS